ncbi:uncharacterized protein LOC144445695 [Glandiceps talaboti]
MDYHKDIYIAHSKVCSESNGITRKDIQDLIRHLEGTRRNLIDEELTCLRRCEKLIVELPRQELKNAKLTVRGKYFMVSFSAGNEYNRYAICLDDYGEPVATKVHDGSIVYVSKGRSSDISFYHTQPGYLLNYYFRQRVYSDPVTIKCDPCIRFRNISEVISTLKFSSRYLRMEDETCLRYCYSLLNEKEGKTWENASISVFGLTVTVTFTSGIETNKFEISLNEHLVPIHIDSSENKETVVVRHPGDDASHSHNRVENERNAPDDQVEDSGRKEKGAKPKVKKDKEPSLQKAHCRIYCNPKVSFEHIDKAIQELGRKGCDVLKGSDKELIDYCLKLVQEVPEEILKHAEIKIYGEKYILTLLSGTGFYKYEITTDSCRHLLCCKTTRENTIQDDIKIKCSPRISFQHINRAVNIVKRRQCSGGDDNKRLLNFCLHFISNSTKPKKIWEDAEVKVIGETYDIIFTSGSGQHKFEIICDSDKEILCLDSMENEDVKEESRTENAAAAPVGEQNKENAAAAPVGEQNKENAAAAPVGEQNKDRPAEETETKKETSQPSPTLYDYTKYCSPPVTADSFQAVIRELKDDLTEEERKLLQHCCKMWEVESKKVGKRLWKDVKITVSGSDRKIVIRTHIDKEETNQYEVIMGEGDTPSYNRLKSGWWESGWSKVPEMPSSVRDYMPWWGKVGMDMIGFGKE